MVKVISLSNEAYETLTKIKGENESFSDVVVKLAKKEKKDITKFFGVWKNNKELIKTFDKIYKNRKNFKLRNVGF